MHAMHASVAINCYLIVLICSFPVTAGGPCSGFPSLNLLPPFPPISPTHKVLHWWNPTSCIHANILTRSFFHR